MALSAADHIMLVFQKVTVYEFSGVHAMARGELKRMKDCFVCSLEDHFQLLAVLDYCRFTEMILSQQAQLWQIIILHTKGGINYKLMYVLVFCCLDRLLGNDFFTASSVMADTNSSYNKVV